MCFNHTPFPPPEPDPAAQVKIPPCPDAVRQVIRSRPAASRPPETAQIQAFLAGFCLSLFQLIPLSLHTADAHLRQRPCNLRHYDRVEAARHPLQEFPVRLMVLDHRNPGPLLRFRRGNNNPVLCPKPFSRLFQQVTVPSFRILEGTAVRGLIQERCEGTAFHRRGASSLAACFRH